MRNIVFFTDFQAKKIGWRRADESLPAGARLLYIETERLSGVVNPALVAQFGYGAINTIGRSKVLINGNHFFGPRTDGKEDSGRCVHFDITLDGTPVITGVYQDGTPTTEVTAEELEAITEVYGRYKCEL